MHDFAFRALSEFAKAIPYGMSDGGQRRRMGVGRGGGTWPARPPSALPVVSAEGAGAIPVVVEPSCQPLFYLHGHVALSEPLALLASLGQSPSRKRRS